jgi:hypothetical protein
LAAMLASMASVPSALITSLAQQQLRLCLLAGCGQLAKLKREIIKGRFPLGYQSLAQDLAVLCFCRTSMSRGAKFSLAMRSGSRFQACRLLDTGVLPMLALQAKYSSAWKVDRRTPEEHDRQ